MQQEKEDREREGILAVAAALDKRHAAQESHSVPTGPGTPDEDNSQAGIQHQLDQITLDSNNDHSLGLADPRHHDSEHNTDTSEDVKSNKAPIVSSSVVGCLD